MRVGPEVAGQESRDGGAGLVEQRRSGDGEPWRTWDLLGVAASIAPPLAAPQLAVESRPHAPVTVDDLRRSAGVFADLDDPDVMGGAWS